MLKNQGQQREVKASRILHQKGVPLIISSQVLRRRGAGQVDIARVHQYYFEIFEIKGPHCTVSLAQKKRLKNSVEFISQVLNRSGIIHFHFMK